MIASRPARKPGRPTQPISRDALITVARVAFAQRGYDGTSMAQVAEAAALRKASLFHHFPTKEALYVAAVEGVVSDLAALIHQARVAEGPFPERLDRLGRLIIRYLSGHREAARLLLREVLDQGPYLRQGGAETVETATALISAFLAAGMDAGAFVRRDPRQLALSIMGLHLFFYAAEDLSRRIVGADIGSPEGREVRTTEVLAQVRALCLDRPGATPPET